jgi:uncharacterized Zn finger protein
MVKRPKKTAKSQVDDEVTYVDEYDDFSSNFPRYVSVAERRDRAESRLKQLSKSHNEITPVVISGRQIATTFWGKSWCNNLETYHDYENRLSRGKSYVRSGSVVDLKIKAGEVTALVEGTSLYEVSIKIDKLDEMLWGELVASCTAAVSSIADLLTGNLSEDVMKVITDPTSGMFPLPSEIKMFCNCLDDATVCKHVAAVLYGVGHRMDTDPELFFVLRSVNYRDLVAEAQHAIAEDVAQATADLPTEDLEDLFGIELLKT